MVENIVLVCGAYYPYFSATGNCIRQIAREFVRKRNNVFVIGKSSDGIESSEFFEGQQLYSVSDSRVRAFARVRDINKSKISGRVEVLFIKSYWATRLLISKSGMDEGLVQAYIKKLEQLSHIGIDAVLPCCMPIEAIKAAYLFCKKNDIKLFPILYDRYSENVDFFRFSWNHRIKCKFAHKFEEKVFDYATITFYVDNWEDYFLKYRRDNVLRVEHPLVVRRERNPRVLDNPTKINVIYQGEINHQMRPPQAMITVFEMITRTDADISLHVFASGNGVADVMQANKRNPEKIRYYGKVSKELADQYYDFADIQIILANRDKNIVSSKIFESVASGYPIIYFYFTEDEKSYKLLKKYPLVLFVRQDEIDEKQCERIRIWIRTNMGKRVDFEFVREAYADATPDLIVESTLRMTGK